MSIKQKVKIITLLDSFETLKKINEQELPVKLSYYLCRNFKRISFEINTYDEQRNKLINKYAVKDENDEVVVNTNENGEQTVKIDDKYMEEWLGEINKLAGLELEISIDKINIEDLINSECKISASELRKIEYLIDNSLA